MEHYFLIKLDPDSQITVYYIFYTCIYIYILYVHRSRFKIKNETE